MTGARRRAGAAPGRKSVSACFSRSRHRCSRCLITAYHMRMMEADWTNLDLPRVLWLEHRRAGSRQRRDAVDARCQHDAVSSTRRQGRPARRGRSLQLRVSRGQVWAWQQLNASGQFTAFNPAVRLLLCCSPAMHGIHLLGRPGGVEQGHACGAVRGADFAQGSPERRAVHRVLALPARGVGGIVRGIAV